MRPATIATTPGRTTWWSWNVMTSNFPTGTYLLELQLGHA